MILSTINNDTLIRGDLGQSTEMSISREVEGHIIKMLTEKGYDDPLGSGLRECVSNAVDSVSEAGKTTPVVVSLKKEGAQWHLQVEDKGLGLDEEGFKKYIMGIGESTKRDKPHLLGGYGLGAKAFLAYTNSYTYTCRKDGVERKYLIFKGVSKPQDSKLYERETSEENGVIVNITLNNHWNESNICVAKIKEQLSYLDNIYYDIPGLSNNYNIFRSEDFQWSTLGSFNEMHISLRGIYYRIDWNKLGINRITVPVALKFDTYEDLFPILNREAIQWDERAIEAVQNKIVKVADYFVGKYNEVVKEFDTFLEAHQFLNPSSYYVTLGEKTFNIDSLKDSSSLTLERPKVKGITVRDAGWYQGEIENLTWEWSAIAYNNNHGIWKRNKIHWYTNIQKRLLDKKKIVLVNEVPSYHVKEYVQQKHGREVAYIQKTRTLHLKGRWESYCDFLELNKKPKDKWREYIKEWQFIRDQLASNFIDETGVENSAGFKDWLQKKKEKQKEDRKRGLTSGNYVGLDKQKGEITVGKLRKASYKDALTSDRSTREIATLYKTKRLNVYFTKVEFDLVAEKVFKLQTAFCSKIDFIILNETEIKHVKDLHQYITLKEFKMSKPFARVATAILIKRLLAKVPENKQFYIRDQFPKWDTLYCKLLDYKSDKLPSGSVPTYIETAILDELTETGNYDQSIIADYHEMRKILDMFYFLHLVKDDSYYETADTKEERRKLVANLILMQKFHMKEMELVPKVPVEVLEDMHQGELVDMLDDDGDIR
jgi:hypothetical protein